jgi:hypothetical protein
MNQEPLPEKKRRLNLISWISLCLGIAAILSSAPSRICLYINWDVIPDEAIGPHPWIGAFGAFVQLPLMIVLFAGLPIFVLSLIFVVISIFKKPRVINFIVCFAGALLIYISLCISAPPLARTHGVSARTFCSNLISLSYSIKEYAQKNQGNLPSASYWCESLIKCKPNTYGFRNEHVKNQEGMSEYAFNANLSGAKLAELPKNTVLFFETPLAKNPAGGPELMSTNNHPIKGCFVLFADMHVAFVRAEDFNNLRWKP